MSSNCCARFSAPTLATAAPIEKHTQDGRRGGGNWNARQTAPGVKSASARVRFPSSSSVSWRFSRMPDTFRAMARMSNSPPTAQPWRRIYGERDLLVAESLRRQLWNGLDAPSLAAMVAAIVYEPRRDDAPLHPRDMPGGAFPDALRATIRAHQKLRDIEADHQVAGTSDLAAHLSLAVYRWASGRRLESVLDGHDVQAEILSAGVNKLLTFWTKSSTVGVGPIHEVALDARARVFRGVVAMSSVA